MICSPFGFLFVKKEKKETAKEQIVESTKEERSWFGFILKIILSLFRTKHIEPHRYSYEENRSSTLSDSQSDQEVQEVRFSVNPNVFGAFSNVVLLLVLI